MTLDQQWEAGLRSELTSMASRSNARLALSDPWYRALTCCLTAQTIREKRTRNAASKPTADFSAPAMDWDMACKDVMQRAQARASRRREKGSWDYSLKVKMTAWRTRADLVANGGDSAPAT